MPVNQQGQYFMNPHVMRQNDQMAQADDGGMPEGAKVEVTKTPDGFMVVKPDGEQVAYPDMNGVMECLNESFGEQPEVQPMGEPQGETNEAV